MVKFIWDVAITSLFWMWQLHPYFGCGNYILILDVAITSLFWMWVGHHVFVRALVGILARTPTFTGFSTLKFWTPSFWTTRFARLHVR